MQACVLGEGRKWQDYFSNECVVQFPCIFHVDPHDFGIGTEEIIENIQREILMGCVCVDELGYAFRSKLLSMH